MASLIPAPVYASTLSGSAACVYVVQPGNTLSLIGRWAGIPWTRLWAYNRDEIPNPNLIYPGERIALCGASGGGDAALVTSHVTSGVWHDEPCASSTLWPDSISLWEVPVGCYGGVYWEGKGDCFGWVHYLVPDIDSLRAHSAPRAGAVIHIPAGDQGASAEGHWAFLLALHGQWALISEENMYWRGGGYNKVTYRYLLLTAGMQYFY
jgi:hypothetical protein